MKNRTTLSRRSRITKCITDHPGCNLKPPSPKAESPEPLLSLKDIPDNPREVLSQRELLTAEIALYILQIARSDYEAKRANVVMKLLRLADLEPGSVEAKLDQDGTPILSDWSSSGPAEIRALIPA